MAGAEGLRSLTANLGANMGDISYVAAAGASIDHAL